MIHKLFTQLTENRAAILHNSNCVYCGVSFEETNHTKEHVVGRRFVPKGTLENQWNLIVRACKRCNEKKADLEDDISAILMQPNLSGEHVSDHASLKEESVKKAEGSISRRTKKLVKDSQEKTPLFSSQNKRTRRSGRALSNVA